MNLEQWLCEQPKQKEVSLEELESLNKQLEALIQTCQDWQGWAKRQLTGMTLLELKRWLEQEIRQQESYYTQAFDRKLVRSR